MGEHLPTFRQAVYNFFLYLLSLQRHMDTFEVIVFDAQATHRINPKTNHPNFFVGQIQSDYNNFEVFSNFFLPDTGDYTYF